MPKISVLPSTDPLDGAESAVVVQAGTTKKTLLSTIRTWLASTFATGPSSSTDNAVVRFDSTTGKLLKDSAVTIANTTGEVGSGGLYKSTVTDGAATVGFVLDTQNALNTAGSKLLSLKNSGTEKVSIDKDGKISSGGMTLTGTSATDAPTLGTELLTTDGWTVGAGWAESPDDTFTHAGSGGTDTLTHSATIANATRYQLTYTITGRTAGTITVTFGGATSEAVSATGAFGPTTSSTAAFTVTPTNDFNGTCVFSLKAITGTSTALVVLNDSTSTPRVSIRVNDSVSTQFIGYQSGQYNTTGFQNTANGAYALKHNTTGCSNTANGAYTLQANTTGNNNTASGVGALFYNTTGYYNTADGAGALTYNTSGYQNTGIGIFSLAYITTGFNNTAIGYSCGNYSGSGTTPNETSNHSLYLGYDVRAGADGDTNEIVIGNSTVGLGSNTTIIGNSSTTKTRICGDIATGLDTPSAAIHALKTTEQLRLGYDDANYASFTVSNAGNLTLTNSGTTIYTDKVIENTVSGAGIILKSPDGTRYLITVADGGILSVAAA